MCDAGVRRLDVTSAVAPLISDVDCPTLIRGHMSDTSVTPFGQNGSTGRKSADLASAAALFLANLMCSQGDVDAPGAGTDHRQYLLR